MDSKKKITISWSGGKDSAFALHRIFQSDQYEIVNLHTVINEESGRVGMHGVPEILIERQARALGIPLVKLYLADSENHEAYQKLMEEYYQQCVDRKIEAVVFGDIFLEDLKTFREQLLHASGLKGIYPLWKENSNHLISEFIDSGFKTMICAANAKFFHPEQLGQTIDHHFIASLPNEVDPCGENGEFHTFVYNGPLFKNPIHLALGNVVDKKYRYQKINEEGNLEPIETTFLFQDLLP